MGQTLPEAPTGCHLVERLAPRGVALVQSARSRDRPLPPKTLVKPEEMLRAFNMSSLSNSLFFPAWPTNFIEGLHLVGREQNKLILLSSSTPDGIDEQFSDDFVTAPWRYAADPAEHNKGKFDIWIELSVLDQHFVIGNGDTVR